MSQGRKNPTGAGAIIALLILGGTILGGLMGQPSIGLLAGTAAGILIALLLWLRERGR
jgi:preprotein translocase subunit SecF